MEKLEFPRVGEQMYHQVLDNGLHIFVVPKPGFQKSYAFFATNYGGMDMKFKLDGQDMDTPAGVAHYLEHKMFDTPDGGNALQTLSATGASPNAFTSTAITGYHFECTDQFWENLKTLLTFVSVPYFTKESVEKEQGIIGQEIRMIEDQPGWQAYHLLLEAMYQHHPVRNSVAGSVESISHITAETLYHCHEAFYTPSNMVLCVAGNVDPEMVCQMARDILPQEKKPPIPRDCGAQESQQVFRQEDSRTMAVSAPLLQMGIKGTAAPDGPSQIRQRLLGELACEILVGSSSPLYNRLYEAGLINSGFYCGYLDYPGCAFLMAGGESQHPEQVRDAILQEGARLAREGVDEALFQRLKKASYGAYVRSLNSFENLCVEQAQGYFAGGDPWTFPELYDTMERQDVEAFLAQWVKPEQTSLVVIRPQEERS